MGRGSRAVGGGGGNGWGGVGGGAFGLLAGVDRTTRGLPDSAIPRQSSVQKTKRRGGRVDQNAEAWGASTSRRMRASAPEQLRHKAGREAGRRADLRAGRRAGGRAGGRAGSRHSPQDVAELARGDDQVTVVYARLASELGPLRLVLLGCAWHDAHLRAPGLAGSSQRQGCWADRNASPRLALGERTGRQSSM